MTTPTTIQAVVPFDENEGFEAQGRRTQMASISIQKLEEQLVSVHGQIGALIDGLRTKLPEENRPKSISVGLAISGQGGIGIATVGAEVAVQLTFDL